jgi:hypothetical protein
MGWMAKVSLHHPDQICGHPASYPMDTRGFLPGDKAGYSPPSNAELKNGEVTPKLPLSSWHSV